MYQIRNASVPREGLITSSELEEAYLNALQNTSSEAALELWRKILTQHFPSSNSGDPFVISSTIDQSVIKAGEDVHVSVSLRAPPKPEHDTRLLLAIGFQGRDKDTKDGRELLVVRFVAWAKKEMKKHSGLRYLFGLLIVGTHARFIRYDKHEEVLKPFLDDDWLDARNGKWKGLVEGVKQAIEEGVAAM